MRLVSFNVENFFARAKALDPRSRTTGRDVLEAYEAINLLLAEATYTAADKRRIVSLLGRLGLLAGDAAEMAVLRQVRGRLVRRPRSGPVEVVAEGRGDWVGWVDLTTEPITEAAVANTARVIDDLAPDVLGVIEAENRVVLKRFADATLRDGDRPRYPHVMLVDGNDDRGIDVALLTRDGWPIDTIRSHVDDTDDRGVVFSRDCPEYEVRTPGGHRLVVLVNHLKSKGFGTKADNDSRRHRQATRVAEIYRRLRAEGVVHVAVIGDLNDTPTSVPLAPLLEGSDLRDISTHEGFADGGRPGTFGTGTAANHIDYILLSPALFGKATGGGIFRMGAWGGVNGTLWPHYDTVTKVADAASDHAALFADLTLT
jgi:endonuclease/exonuclease/phosphatase family metal-dependent hydrolase